MNSWLRAVTSICVVSIVAVGGASRAVAQSQELPGSAANVPSARQPASAAASATAGSGGAKASERLREGTKLIDVVGTFQSIGGESVTFTPAGSGTNKESFKVLENLALQRVSQELDGNKGARQWTVSAEVTEYKGNNYLLLKKIVVHPQEGDTAASQ
jgi:hypothetical protein